MELLITSFSSFRDGRALLMRWWTRPGYTLVRWHRCRGHLFLNAMVCIRERLRKVMSLPVLCWNVGVKCCKSHFGFFLFQRGVSNALHVQTQSTDSLWRCKIFQKLVLFHQRGVIHGDFAERNVLEKDGDIRLIDFDQSICGHECHCDSLIGGGQLDPKRAGCDELRDVYRHELRLWSKLMDNPRKSVLTHF